MRTFENTTSAAASSSSTPSPQADLAVIFVSAVREPRSSTTDMSVFDAYPGTSKRRCPPEYLNPNSRELLHVDDAISSSVQVSPSTHFSFARRSESSPVLKTLLPRTFVNDRSERASGQTLTQGVGAKLGLGDGAKDRQIMKAQHEISPLCSIDRPR